jgi:MYXO-CTERM domain-containing protein
VAPDGTACDDENACTQGESCVSGVCQGGEEIECQPSDDCHLAGQCDPQTGVCTDPPKEDGQACDDENPCTQSDSCQAGQCSGTPVADGTACPGGECVAGECQDAGEEEPEDSGCGCAHGDRSPAPAGLMLLGLIGLLRRRRTR